MVCKEYSNLSRQEAYKQWDESAKKRKRLMQAEGNYDCEEIDYTKGVDKERLIKIRESLRTTTAKVIKMSSDFISNNY
jgi:uncharacterized membrane protein YqiK